MISPLNQLLFYLSILFYSPVPFISQETAMKVELSQKKVELIFYNLETPEKDQETAKAALLQVDSAKQTDPFLVEYNPGFDQLKLKSKRFQKSKKQLDAHISLSFSDAQSALKAFGIHHADGKYIYALQEKERVVSTNGKVVRENDQKFIVWHDELELIQLHLKRARLDDPNLQNLVNAAGYWE